MEMVVEEDSPLASYLESNSTNHDDHLQASRTPSTVEVVYSFAPSNRTLPIRCPSRQPPPQHKRTAFVSSLQNGYARVVSSTLGKADNERFLEHFRYIIIASQLLNERLGTFSRSINISGIVDPSQCPPPNPSTFVGVIVSTALSFGLVWLIHWVRAAKSSDVRNTRLLLVCSIKLLAAFLLYAYARRHWLKCLRREAVVAISRFVEEVQHFESSSASVLKQIQEIEVVSWGYQISTPLPPVSRLEVGGQPQTCHRVRGQLRRIYESANSAFLDAIDVVSCHASNDEFHRFLEVYDVQPEDALALHANSADKILHKEDSLAHLRELQYRLSTLRRLLLCYLLSIPATGQKQDRSRWRTTVAQTTFLGTLLSDSSQSISLSLLDEENPPMLSPAVGHTHPSPGIYNPHLAAFILQLRTLHAKLHLVRSDVGRLTSMSSSAISDPTSREQFEMIGIELGVLVQTWERGRAVFTDLLADKNRTFHANVGGLGTIPRFKSSENEARGGSSEVLGMLNGLFPASPPLSTYSGSCDEPQGLGLVVPTPLSEHEVFEAVSCPKQRPILTREQRIVRMQEDRERQTKKRELKETSSNMLKELQAVIKLRPSSVRTPQ